MSHAQRFDAVGAQKGTPLYGVVTALKQVAMTVEESYDPNSPEVTGAMQRFEQGLALIASAPESPAAGSGDEQQDESDGPKATTRRQTAKGSGKGGDAG